MTAQIRDILIYNGETLYLATEPLEEYLKENSLTIYSMRQSSACWKGYIAKWIIESEKLYLAEIKGLDPDDEGQLYRLFQSKDRVFADWYTGTLRFGVGDMIEYVHSGYSTKFEGDMYMTIDRGVLVDVCTEWHYSKPKPIPKYMPDSFDLDDLPF